MSIYLCWREYTTPGLIPWLRPCRTLSPAESLLWLGIIVYLGWRLIQKLLGSVKEGAGDDL